METIVPGRAAMAFAVAAVVTGGCNCTTPGRGAGGWEVDARRTLTYSLEATDAAGGASTNPLLLSFDGGGKLRVSLAGAPVGSFTMSRSGKLVPDAPDAAVPIYLELLSLVPDDPRALDRVGATWSRRFPPDAELRGDTVIYRTEISARVTSVGDEVVTELEGTGALVTNDGLKQGVESFFGSSPSPELAAVITAYSTPNRYLTGTLRFDRKAGQVKELAVAYVKLPDRSLTAAEIAASPARETMTWRLQ